MLGLWDCGFEHPGELSVGEAAWARAGEAGVQRGVAGVPGSVQGRAEVARHPDPPKMGFLEEPRMLPFVRPCALLLSLCEREKLSCWMGSPCYQRVVSRGCKPKWQAPWGFLPAEGPTPSPGSCLLGLAQHSATPTRPCFSLPCCKCQKCQLHKVNWRSL